MISNRLNSCSSFRDGRCQHRLMMEKLYLIPQILSVSVLQKHGNVCLQCGEYTNWLGEIPLENLKASSF
jgi:hypothetical protein